MNEIDHHQQSTNSGIVMCGIGEPNVGSTGEITVGNQATTTEKKVRGVVGNVCGTPTVTGMYRRVTTNVTKLSPDMVCGEW